MLARITCTTYAPFLGTEKSGEDIWVRFTRIRAEQEWHYKGLIRGSIKGSTPHFS
jgi:hypothetical protein